MLQGSSFKIGILVTFPTSQFLLLQNPNPFVFSHSIDSDIHPLLNDQSNQTHDVACVVNEFSQEFDIDKLLEEGDQQVVSVLPSIHSVERDALVEMTTGDSLDELFVRMVISDSNTAAETKNEESEGSDIEEDDDQQEEMADDNSNDESDDAMNDARASAPHVKNPIRANDEYNPQLNQQRKKQQKKQRKLQKKLKVANQEPFDFKTDFIADSDLVPGDENDDDLLNI